MKEAPIPTNGLRIAATAMQYDLKLITTDGHYQQLPQIIVVLLCLIGLKREKSGRDIGALIGSALMMVLTQSRKVFTSKVTTRVGILQKTRKTALSAD